MLLGATHVPIAFGMNLWPIWVAFFVKTDLTISLQRELRPAEHIPGPDAAGEPTSADRRPASPGDSVQQSKPWRVDAATRLASRSEEQ